MKQFKVVLLYASGQKYRMLTGCWEIKHWGKLAVVFVMTVLKQKRGMIQTHVETWSSSELFFGVLAYACSLMYCRLHNQVETQRHSKIAALNQLSRHTHAQGVKSSCERNFSCTICHNALQKWLKHVSHMVKFFKKPFRRGHILWLLHPLEVCFSPLDVVLLNELW